MTPTVPEAEELPGCQVVHWCLIEKRCGWITKVYIIVTPLGMVVEAYILNFHKKIKYLPWLFKLKGIENKSISWQTFINNWSLGRYILGADGGALLQSQGHLKQPMFYIYFFCFFYKAILQFWKFLTHALVSLIPGPFQSPLVLPIACLSFPDPMLTSPLNISFLFPWSSWFLNTVHATS